MPFRLPDWLKGSPRGAVGNTPAAGADSWDRGERNYANPVQNVHVWEFNPQDSANAAIQVVTPTPVYEAICRQADQALPNETGGFLIGQVERDIGRHRWLLHIDQAEPVEPMEADPTHFTFSWRDVQRVRSSREQTGKALVGWYHTHPDHGVFLSRTDVEKTHNRLFNDPFQIALVLDPIRGTAAYFCRDGVAVFDTPKDQFQLKLNEDTTV